MIACDHKVKEKSALGDGLSDIGRFSLPESNFEGTRQSRVRGLFEHEKINRKSLESAKFRNARKKKSGLLEILPGFSELFQFCGSKGTDAVTIKIKDRDDDQDKNSRAYQPPDCGESQ